MSSSRVELIDVQIPQFTLPASQPEITRAEYAARLDATRQRARERGLDFLLVYGDREHNGSITYLTDHDCRFEESLLVIPAAGGRPSLIVGNEGMGFASLCPLDVDLVLYQGFSLMGQPRETAPRLEPILRDLGLRAGARVGVAGWKYASPAEADDPAHWLDLPSFVADLLREVAGDSALVTNETSIFADPQDGLRARNSADQLAQFEYAAAWASEHVKRILTGLRPGMTELEAFALAGFNGTPWSIHVVFSAGPRGRVGFSPTGRPVQIGDPFLVGIGLRGSLTARVGWVAYDECDLPAESADYLERMAVPYYRAVGAWWESLGLGVTGGALHDAVYAELAGTGVRPTLNAGHLIHVEEWLHSPVFAGSTFTIESGTLIQCDIIPTADEPRLHSANVEDTVALADEALRADLAARYPELWARVQARRAFMQDVLGFRLRPEVLPFSNFPGLMPPFALRPSRVLALR